MTQLLQTLILGLLLGGVYALAAYFTWWAWRDTGVDPLLMILVTTPVMFALGWLTYQVFVRRLRGAPASMSVLLTFALALVIQGVLGLSWNNLYRAVRPGYADESFHFWSLYLPKART